MFVYLDESGSFGKDKEKFFIVGSYTVGAPKRIANAYRRWQRRKFPKKLRVLSEVKFNEPSLSDELRLKTVSFLSEQDIRIFYTYLDKRNIPAEYRSGHKVDATKTGVLYAQIVGAALELYLPISSFEFRVFRDARPLKGISKAEFNQVIESRVSPQLPAKAVFQMEAVDSTTHPQIQVADWVCGALARYHEKKDNGELFYQILRNNLVEKKELFAKYWEEKWSGFATGGSPKL
jgi:hypothetical protein